MSAQPTIRLATEEDVPYILQFIRELADYEHALDQVEATESSLLSTLSFANSSAETQSKKKGSTWTALVYPAQQSSEPNPNPNPREEEKPVGMALYFYNYSTWRSAPGIYLEDLYVQPSARGKGYGLALFKYLANEVVSIGGKRLEWSVLKWNEPSIKFYKGLGAKQMVEWEKMMLDGGELERLASS